MCPPRLEWGVSPNHGSTDAPPPSIDPRQLMIRRYDDDDDDEWFGWRCKQICVNAGPRTKSYFESGFSFHEIPIVSQDGGRAGANLLQTARRISIVVINFLGKGALNRNSWSYFWLPETSMETHGTLLSVSKLN